MHLTPGDRQSSYSGQAKNLGKPGIAACLDVQGAVLFASLDPPCPNRPPSGMQVVRTSGQLVPQGQVAELRASALSRPSDVAVFSVPRAVLLRMATDSQSALCNDSIVVLQVRPGWRRS